MRKTYFFLLSILCFITLMGCNKQDIIKSEIIESDSYYNTNLITEDETNDVLHYDISDYNSIVLADDMIWEINPETINNSYYLEQKQIASNYSQQDFQQIAHQLLGENNIIESDDLAIITYENTNGDKLIITSNDKISFSYIKNQNNITQNNDQSTYDEEVVLANIKNKLINIFPENYLSAVRSHQLNWDKDLKKVKLDPVRNESYNFYYEHVLDNGFPIMYVTYEGIIGSFQNNQISSLDWAWNEYQPVESSLGQIKSFDSVLNQISEYWNSQDIQAKYGDTLYLWRARLAYTNMYTSNNQRNSDEFCLNWIIYTNYNTFFINCVDNYMIVI